MHIEEDKLKNDELSISHPHFSTQFEPAPHVMSWFQDRRPSYQNLDEIKRTVPQGLYMHIIRNVQNDEFQ